MLRGIFFATGIIFCFCTLAVIHSKSTNSFKVWIIFDRSVNAETWWNTFANFFTENFVVSPVKFRVYKEFDSSILVGHQNLLCGVDNFEIYSNWSRMDLLHLMQEEMSHSALNVVIGNLIVLLMYKCKLLTFVLTNFLSHKIKLTKLLLNNAYLKFHFPFFVFLSV